MVYYMYVNINVSMVYFEIKNFCCGWAALLAIAERSLGLYKNVNCQPD